jgi:hypothetical protein
MLTMKPLLRSSIPQHEPCQKHGCDEVHIQNVADVSG